ncbi:hypothetical protein IU428_18700 [Nocardia abscessus]|uniref:hypothetical protein n=1 Tax=Nocardia abscessus TaxID=120957 RepID=UPI0018958EF8|nr:hypothetical protein [Nocardia abscessus]MBF6473840.1 hypothetical protein [Nocardia abscessus]
MFDNPYVVYRLSDGRIVEPGRLYRLHNGKWAEPWPRSSLHCGQQFGPRRMLVGSLACLQASGLHRLHSCTACGHVVYTPPVDADCEHPATRST